MVTLELLTVELMLETMLAMITLGSGRKTKTENTLTDGKSRRLFGYEQIAAFHLLSVESQIIELLEHNRYFYTFGNKRKRNCWRKTPKTQNLFEKIKSKV